MNIKTILNKNKTFNRTYNILRSFMWIIESKYYGMKTPAQREDIVARKYKKY